MKKPVFIVGMGEMGGVFARGILKAGHPVYPITRDMDMSIEAAAMAEPELVLVAVGENDLHPTLESLPAAWHNKIGLLQNELLPRDWEKYGYKNITAIPVWFEKKKGQDFKVLISSPVFGPHAALLHNALSKLDISCCILEDEASLLFELVRKNVYILTTNISGLEVGGNVEQLWNTHRELASSVAAEVIQIQEYLTNTQFDHKSLIDGLVEAINGDPEHKCMGRSAPARLQRAIEHANAAGLDVPVLRKLHAQQKK